MRLASTSSFADGRTVVPCFQLAPTRRLGYSPVDVGGAYAVRAGCSRLSSEWSVWPSAIGAVTGYPLGGANVVEQAGVRSSSPIVSGPANIPRISGKTAASMLAMRSLT